MAAQPLSSTALIRDQALRRMSVHNGNIIAGVLAMRSFRRMVAMGYLPRRAAAVPCIVMSTIWGAVGRISDLNSGLGQSI
jgi:hypothetical protein